MASPLVENGSKRKRQEDDKFQQGSPAAGPVKKLRASPNASQSPNGAVDTNASTPKPLTAATLASIKIPKKAPSERSKPVRRRQRTPVPERPASPQPIRSPSRSPPRQRKRPGGGARVDQAAVEAVRRRQDEREKAEAQAAQAEAARNGINNVVTQHYNAVPERGREWRQSGSMIKGLRSFNNWVKSAVIQKFSPTESFRSSARQYGNQQRRDEEGLKILDIGCGKGGDLQKWQNAPQPVELYVALDPADVSVEQARSRYRTMSKFGRGDTRGRPLFHAEFIAKDCFGESLGDVPIIRQVGIDSSGGPMSNGGFDVVSMMFCMHYAFENEAKARGMLQNVSGALKKGGRFLGVIPNSDVLSAKVKSLTQGNAKRAAPADDEDEWDPERPAGSSAKKQKIIEDGDGEDDWDPEKSSDPIPQPSMDDDDDDDDWDPEKPADPQLLTSDAPNGTQGDPDSANHAGASTTPQTGNTVASQGGSTDTPITQNGIEWGNSIYRVKFPSKVPVEGVFRPSYGWKYFFFLEEAVEEIPEYVVPWEAFRAMAVDYNLELQYRKPFSEVWAEEKDDPKLGQLSERTGVRGRGGGELMVSKEEMEAASFYHAFCFYKV